MACQRADACKAIEGGVLDVTAGVKTSESDCIESACIFNGKCAFIESACIESLLTLSCIDTLLHCVSLACRTSQYDNDKPSVALTLSLPSVSKPRG